MNQKTKYAIFTMSNKGGIGKSEIALAAVSALRNQKLMESVGYDEPLKVAAFTGDTENWHAVNCLGGDNGNAYTNIVRLDFTTVVGRDKLLDMVLSHQEADILFVDFPANSLNVLTEILEDPSVYFEEVHAAGYQPIVILPFDAQPDTLDSIEQAALSFGKLPHYVVAKNLKGVSLTAFEPVAAAFQKKREGLFSGKTVHVVDFPTFEPEILKISLAEGKGTCYQDIDIHPTLSKSLAVKIRHRRKMEQVAQIIQTILK